MAPAGKRLACNGELGTPPAFTWKAIKLLLSSKAARYLALYAGRYDP